MRPSPDRLEDSSKILETRASLGSYPAGNQSGSASRPGRDERRVAMRRHSSRWNHIRAAASLLGALMAGSAWPDGRPGPGAIQASGEVLAVGDEDGTLLLDGEHGVKLLVVHPEAEIRDFRSEAALALARIRPGDLVEYTTEFATGMALVVRLVVTPLRPRAWTARHHHDTAGQQTRSALTIDDESHARVR